MLVDVFLDTGVCVSIPNGTNTESDEGHRLLKQVAKEKLIALIQSDAFDVTFGVVEHEESI